MTTSLRPNRVREQHITGRQWTFISEYMIDLHKTDAARRAGYKNAQVMAARLTDGVNYPLVAAEIEKRLEKKRKKCDIKAEMVVNELAKIAFANPKHLIDGEGKPIPLHELPDDVAAALSSMTVREKLGADGRVVARETDLERWNKLEALKQLGQHLGLIKEHGDTQVNVAVAWNQLPVAESAQDKTDRLESKITEAGQ